MSNKGKYYSKDGHYYDTLEEAVSAGWAWDEKQGLQKEQNKLIEQQNQLIMQQNENNNRLARQKMEDEYEIEMEKLEIEKEKNKQQLFNALSISKKTYDKYINKNYENANIRDDINQLYEKRNNYEYYSEDTDERLKYISSSRYTYDLYKECLTIPEYKMFKSKSEWKLFTALIIADSFLVGIIVCLIIFLIDYFSFILFLILIVSIVLFVFSAKFVIPRLSYQTEDTVEQYLKTYTKFDKERFIKLLNEEIKKCDEALDSLYEKLHKNIHKSYDEFTQFRLNHYNKEIEQLLSDCGYREMVEDAGIEYKSVNSKNKIKDGKIEDYIVYFDEHI